MAQAGWQWLGFIDTGHELGDLVGQRRRRARRRWPTLFDWPTAGANDST